MGTIYKRRNVYYINVIADGRRVRKKVGTSKRIAELALKDLELQIARKEFNLDVPDGTLDEVFRVFLEYSETNHAPATRRRYGQVIQSFQFFLALRHPNITKVSQLDLSAMEAFKRFRRTTDPRNLSLPEGFPFIVRPNSHVGKTRTVNYELKTLRSFFSFGQKRRLCNNNPCDGITYLKVNDSQEPRFLTVEECNLLLEYSDRKTYPIIYTFLNTGLRLGELVNLQWGDVDFERRVLKVRRKNDWQPKSGEREIPLNDGMIELLTRLRPRNACRTIYAFSGADGGRLKRKLRKDLIRTARKAGLDDVTKIHSLRHTFASHLVMKGVDLPTVQKLLGHSDIRTTMIYAHLAPEHLADAVKKLTFDDTF